MKSIHIVILVGLGVLLSCQPKSERAARADEDLDMVKSLFSDIPTYLVGKEIQKTIRLDGVDEKRVFVVDSILIDQDLKVLDGKDMIRVFTNGGYNKTTTDSLISYERKLGEKQGPLSMSIKKTNDQVDIELVGASDNVLFHSEVRRKYKFENGMLSRYQIHGMQQVTGKQPSRYEVVGIVN